MSSFIDCHNHCLPNIDDGSKSVDESLAMLRQAVESSIALVFVTPHSMPKSIYDPTLSVIKEKLNILNELIIKNHLPIQVKYGSELRVNEHTLDFVYEKQYIPYEDTDYVLLELTRQNLHQGIVNEIIDELHFQQRKVLIAHPERYFTNKEDAIKQCQKWLKQGVYLQINRTSLLKDHHPQERDIAQTLFNQGLVHIIASDAHSATTRRILKLDDIYEQIASSTSKAVADCLLVENPKRLSENKALLLPKMKEIPFLKRLKLGIV